MVGKKVPSFISLLSLWVSKTPILTDISEHPTKVKILFNLNLSFQFFFVSHFFHFFFVHATCTIELNSMGERISPCIHRL